MSWFQSKNAQAAARNDLIFQEEQKPLLNLLRTADELKAVAEAARARGDAHGADLFQKEADELAVRLQAISSHCSHRAFKRVNESTVNVLKIDLHAQLPSQAVQLVQQEILRIQAITFCSVKTELHIVTGAGTHSKSGQPKVKAAVEQYLQSKAVTYTELASNKGMLVVALPIKAHTESKMPLQKAESVAVTAIICCPTEAVVTSVCKYYRNGACNCPQGERCRLSHRIPIVKPSAASVAAAQAEYSLWQVAYDIMPMILMN